MTGFEVPEESRKVEWHIALKVFGGVAGKVDVAAVGLDTWCCLADMGLAVVSTRR
jgi:hypothetical protein